MLQPYREIHGYIIPETALISIPDGTKAHRRMKAQYVWCEERNGLVDVEKCKTCEYFEGYAPRAVQCNSESKNEPPYYYNQPMSERFKNQKDNE